MKSTLAIVCLCLAVAQQANGGSLKSGIGSLLMNVFQYQGDAETPLGRSLVKASCSDRAVKAAESRGWKACIKLTQSITLAQQLGLDVYELSQEVRAAGAEFYQNVSTCRGSLTDAAICFTKYVEEAGPAYHRLVAAALEHLEKLKQLRYEIVSHYSGCFTKDSYAVEGRSYNLQSLVESFCPTGTSLDDMYQAQARSLAFHMSK